MADTAKRTVPDGAYATERPHRRRGTGNTAAADNHQAADEHVTAAIDHLDATATDPTDNAAAASTVAAGFPQASGTTTQHDVDDDMPLNPPFTGLPFPHADSHRVVAPIAQRVDSNQRKRQVVFEFAKTGRPRVALLMYTAPVSDIRVSFPRFCDHKINMPHAQAGTVPYFAFADLPALATARAEAPARSSAAADSVLPGYHCYELSGPDSRDPSYSQAVFEAWHTMAYNYVDVDLHHVQGAHATRRVTTHTYEVVPIQRVPYFHVKWPLDAPDISHRDFEFNPPSRGGDRGNRTRGAAAAQSASAADASSPLKKNKSSHTSKATWIKRGPNSLPLLLTLGFTANRDRVSLEDLITQLRDSLDGMAQVLDLWLSHDAVTRPDEGSTPSQYTYADRGEYFVLIALTQNDQPAVAPEAVRYGLPGFIHLDGKEYSLRYRERRPFCPICKPTLASYHEKSTCPQLDCKHCGKAGNHFSYKCPTLEQNKPRPAGGASNATPARVCLNTG